MAHAKSREIFLATKMTDVLQRRLDELRQAWKNDPAVLPKGLTCSESGAGDFVLVAAESAFTTLPGACVIKGIGAIELQGEGPLFEEGANSKSLLLRPTADGWQFSIKFVPPKVRDSKQP